MGKIKRASLHFTAGLESPKQREFLATPPFIDDSLSENQTAVEASRLTFFKDEPNN
jgi:hypothetical protein